MNKKIVKSFFPQAVKDYENKICPFCKEKIENNFKDELSRKEYKISGLCQKCQDKMFK